MKNFVLVFCVLLLTPFTLLAQEEEVGYNENSVHPIHNSKQLFKKRVWRRMDLNEKQNQPFFAVNNQITKFIIEAVQNGELIPYDTDSVTDDRRISKEEFMSRLEIKTDAGGGDFGGWGDDGGDWGEGGATASAGPSKTYIRPDELNLLEIVEDAIFDNQRSRMYFDLQAITVKIPADLTVNGLEGTLASFRYKDLEELFRAMPDKAQWYNMYNQSKSVNFADAFLLRLFSARIWKVNNPQDEDLYSIYGGNPKRALYASQQEEYKLMEYEHNLWEY
ncbi:MULTISPECIES: gliding motility protein GldN [Persicobacter]|uniref:Gliding motility protein GldN n=1 Tax=Persicobacter diffluens TaxID=981 RepID=A0AAN5AKK1_9BACT|nr:gliding motility protein GldN [Persicobacter sp. CCB-QB2]GJM62214.1 hypothetical protein PEDI_27660 [Persicobacter diffluens]